MDIHQHQLKARELKKTCNPSTFKFRSTEELAPLKGIIGQDRAVSALEFGLEIENYGYHIYLSGEFGTGKTSLAEEMLRVRARQKPVPPDWIYVNNFKSPDCPLALEVPAGIGKKLKHDISAEINEVIKQVVKALESEDFERKKNEIVNAFVEETNRMYLRLEEFARGLGFAISKTQAGISSIPVKSSGEHLSQEEYNALGEDEKKELMRKSNIVQEKINETYRHYKEAERQMKEKLRQYEYQTARAVSELFFNRLLASYQDYPGITEYLHDMQEDLLKKIDIFVEPDDPSPASLFKRLDKKAALRRYDVNLIVDNSLQEHAPVIFEVNPHYANLFGQIEYQSEFGILATDFSKIKAGSIHKANGGYLVLQIKDVLKNLYVWDTLKRILINQEIIIESMGKNLGLSNTETLEPQPIPVNVKVVLIGEPIYYYLLYHHDEDFKKLFKIKADFDFEMPRNRKNILAYTRFIAEVCKTENLRHLTPEAVAEVINYGALVAGDQTKLTARFYKLSEIIMEANALAARGKSELIEGDHILQAIRGKNRRSAIVEEKIREQIARDHLIINVEGDRIGEINGLTVLDIGDYRFGKPARITAKTYMGEKGIVNIEREIRLSGSIHSKGIFTLNGYLGAQYAQDKPLSLSASLTFEQSYFGVEGDSASSAELYALISSLAGVPINQGIAVTGSVNQNGDVQPIGGVNYKIEGFFRVCELKGFNGRQGVIIPRKNIEQLMLNDDIIEAVRKKRFTIWAVDHIDQGLEILTGVPSGNRSEKGFTEGSIHYLAERKLNKWQEKKLSRYPRTMPAKRSSRAQGRRRRIF